MCMKCSGPKGEGVIYLAGGCFWGIEKLIGSLPGVTSTVCGYANGTGAEDANYPAVCRGRTGFRETVRVRYNRDVTSLDAILFAFLKVIDTTVENAQGNDVGPQYQTGIYYQDGVSGAIAERIAAIESQRRESFKVEIGPLRNFFEAEPVHQKYLDRKPQGYCHIDPSEFAVAKAAIVDPGKYVRPNDEEIMRRLEPMQYGVTQENETEPPFDSALNGEHGRGIYVDVVTGEPLFSSRDKYDSSCGWPSFTKGVDPNVLVYMGDDSYGMVRTEVRSRAGNSHLGHVFLRDPESPNGIRYCINGAALRFVPYERMDELGYGYLKDHV
jgi:peptide methionine sulfoxide reductase msrA/msrB